MTWVRIDDGFADHPKIVAAGPLAAIIQVRAICYCGRHLTDGFLPYGAVAGLLSGMEHISIATGGVPGLFEVGADATEIPWSALMVEHNLWEKVAGGYRVHDYLDYQRSKKEVVELRKKKVKAGKAGGLAFARARATARDEHAGTEEEDPPTPPLKTKKESKAVDSAVAVRASRAAPEAPSAASKPGVLIGFDPWRDQRAGSGPTRIGEIVEPAAAALARPLIGRYSELLARVKAEHPDRTLAEQEALALTVFNRELKG